MKFTESQSKYIQERIKMRFGFFRGKYTKKPVSIKYHKCPICGHEEIYLLYGECPICGEPVIIEGYQYMLGNSKNMAYELSMTPNSFGNVLAGRRTGISESKFEILMNVLGLTVEDIENA